MKELKNQGVEWDRYYVFRELLAAKSTQIISMRWERFKEYITKSKEDLERKDPLWENVFEKLWRQVSGDSQGPDFMYRRIGQHGMLLCLSGYSTTRHPSCEYRSQSNFDVITGHTTHNNTRIKVQLIFSARKSPLEHVIDFYASHVQCAITPYGAIHFDWENAKNQMGGLWPRNSQAKMLVPLAIEKYEQRGWEFHRQSENERIVRTTTSPEVKVVEFNVELEIDPTLERTRRRAFQHLTWEQAGGRTVMMMPSNRPPRTRCSPTTRDQEKTRCDDVDFMNKHAITSSRLTGTLPEFVLVI